MMQELISIVIPVYNAETFLTQCLNSILAQTYQNIEVICIDDASTDKSFDLLKMFEEKDHRVKVYSKKNEGVSRARNLGIDKSNGELLMFVDADDWIDENTCSRAYEEMKTSNADVVMWAYVSEFENRSNPKCIYTEKILFAQDKVKDRIHRRFIGVVDDELSEPQKADSLCSVWGKLYRKKLITDNNIHFIDLNEIGTYEDGMFNLHVFQYVKSAVYIPEYLYHYRRTNGDSQTSKYRENLPEQWNRLFGLMQKYIEENNLDNKYTIALNNRIALSILGLGLNVMMSSYSVREKRKLIKNIITTERYKKASSILKMRYLRFHWKIFYGSAALGISSIVYLQLVIIRKIVYG